MEFTGERLIIGQVDKELELEHLNRYRFACQFVGGREVLDAACGSGYGSAMLSREARHVCGVDISAESIAFARENYAGENITFTEASVESLPFGDDIFDTAVSFETLEHVDEATQERFLDELCRVLRDDGTLIISTPNREIYDKRGENEFHVRELSFEEFRELLERHFPCVEFFCQQWEVCDAILPKGGGEALAQNGLPAEQAEYLIAVCSRQPRETAKASFFIRDDHKLDTLLSWATENHRLNEKKDAHILALDEELRSTIREKEDRLDALRQSEQVLRGQVNNQSIHIEQLLQSERELQGRVDNQSIHIEQLMQSERELQATLSRQKRESEEAYQALKEEKEQEAATLCRVIEERDRTIRNKEGHIEQLLEVDRELQRIKSSRSWRYMGYVWRLRDWLVPKGSRRRLAVKMGVKFLKHPLRFLRKCTPGRICKFFRSVNREGVEFASRRLDDCLIGNDIPPMVLSVESVSPERAEAEMPAYAPLSVPRWDAPTVSIVIPVYNQFDYTYHCAKSILENSGEVTYEILLADDCSTDATANVGDIIDGLRVIRNGENLRFLRNCNHAAQYAKGEYILFLNNDTQVQKDWLAPLTELMERDESVGMVGSKLVYPDGRLQEAGGILWQDGSAWNYGNRSDPEAPEYNYVKEADYISGAAIMIRRCLWEEIGGFDERFVPAYCEDSDLAFEVRAHGYKVMYQPKSVVVHFEGVSNGTDVTQGQKAYQITNQQKFYEKWKSVLEAEHYPNAQHVFLAKDRGQGKKVLLMVDHYVPQYDKDAGSRTVFQYLQLFVREGYRVKFIGDNFFPHQPYTDTLQQMGVEVLYGPWYARHWKDWLRENGMDIGYVWLNRPHISVKYIDLIRQYSKARIMYYGMDLAYLREQRRYETTGDREALKTAETMKPQEYAIMRKADVSYFLSRVEMEKVREEDPSIRTRHININIFDGLSANGYMPAERKDMIFVGGFSHAPNVDAVRFMRDQIFPQICRTNPEIRIHVVGSNPPDEVLQAASENILIEGFVTDERLAELYASARLAFIPLRYGAGVKGKVIEALKYGLPTVTTSIGAEGIEDAEDILQCADTAEELAARVCSLYHDEESLCRLSAAGEQYVSDMFSPASALRKIAEDFDLPV